MPDASTDATTPTPSVVRLTWSLAGSGWATCTLETADGTVEVLASRIGNAPEDLLTAVARLVAGAAETRAQFEAEPTAFRWIFRRDGHDARLRLLELPHGRSPDSAGTVLWSGRLGVDAVARAVTRCFDEVVRVHGESGYLSRWGAPFPRWELQALRRLRRDAQP
ncbi:hypothetical protein [Streptomyces sp. NPDC058731]|uniref:hypothetical protein n=1 Tax=Streptomyces sp. NPDC058731 TaxID=3346613 RepID=UPI0036C803F4